MSAPRLFDHEAERRVLTILSDVSTGSPGGARVLLDKHGTSETDFHAPGHADLFRALVGLVNRDAAADPASLGDALRGCEAILRIGGAEWVAKTLTAESCFEGQYVTAAKTIRDMATRRATWAAARKAMDAALDMERDATEALSASQGEFASIVARESAVRTLQDVLQDTLAELDDITNGRRPPVIPTGIEMLDQVIGGFPAEYLSVIGARPGVGKSALLATCIQSYAERGERVGVFSLEDRASWLVYRLLAHRSGVPVKRLKTTRLADYQMESVNVAAERLWNFGANVFLDDRSGLTPQQVANTARHMIVVHGCRAIFVDHLGEMNYRSARRDRFDLDVAEGLTELRAIAKQYRVPVVLAAQLKRDVDDRADIRMSDFANCAGIEHKARLALALSRKAGDGRLTVTVLKQTEGIAGVRVHLDFHGPAALVKTTGGDIEGQEAA